MTGYYKLMRLCAGGIPPCTPPYSNMKRNTKFRIIFFAIIAVVLAASLCSCAPDLEVQGSFFTRVSVSDDADNSKAHLNCEHREVSYHAVYPSLYRGAYSNGYYHAVSCKDADGLGCEAEWIEEHTLIYTGVWNQKAEMYNGRYYHMVKVSCTVCTYFNNYPLDYVLCSENSPDCDGGCECVKAFLNDPGER